MDNKIEQELTVLYQRYLEQKQKKSVEQLERALFHTIDRTVPAPDPMPVSQWASEQDLIKYLRTLPRCVQELYGLPPTEPADAARLS